MAVSTGLSLQRSGFIPKSLRVGFVAYRLAVGQVFVCIFQLTLVSIILSVFHIYISFTCHQHCIISATDFVVE
jgi:hypothetical protein